MRVTVEFTQVKGPELVTVTVGTQTSEVTTVLAVAVQPLDCVTVTVYVPVDETVVVAVVAPLLHKYETIEVPVHAVAVAVRVTVEAVQAVIGPLFVAVSVGVQILEVTVVLAVETQPLDWVTVTV